MILFLYKKKIVQYVGLDIERLVHTKTRKKLEPLGTSLNRLENHLRTS